MNDRIPEIDGGALGAPLEQAREHALELAAALRERVAEGSESIRAYTLNQPARALGIALGVGVLLGWLIKRR
jgi:ElaB/YqjD/DUF883 family membrane-anchored ribosome-binding protein